MVMEVLVCPLLQRKEEPPVTVRVALLPLQMVVFPLTLAVIVLVTVTVATALAEQIPLVTRTV